MGDANGYLNYKCAREVITEDYKRVLATIEKAHQSGTSEDEAVMEPTHG